MAGAPIFKVYIAGHYVAATKTPEDAAMILSGNGAGEIRVGHAKSQVAWTYSGAENMPSYDKIAVIVYRFIEENQ